MLEQVLVHINNWFERDIYEGHFVVSGNRTELPFLQDGQYYRIVGSVFNDGLHRYNEFLKDEEFDGAIWALAVPESVISLSDEIGEWQEQNGNIGAFSSESFGGYSYQRLTDGNGKAATWQSIFRSRLNKWRKL